MRGTGSYLMTLVRPRSPDTKGTALSRSKNSNVDVFPRQRQLAIGLRLQAILILYQQNMFS